MCAVRAATQHTRIAPQRRRKACRGWSIVSAGVDGSCDKRSLGLICFLAAGGRESEGVLLFTAHGGGCQGGSGIVLSNGCIIDIPSGRLSDSRRASWRAAAHGGGRTARPEAATELMLPETSPAAGPVATGIAEREATAGKLSTSEGKGTEAARRPLELALPAAVRGPQRATTANNPGSTQYGSAHQGAQQRPAGLPVPSGSGAASALRRG